MSRDYGDQYGEVGELEGSNNSSDVPSQGSEPLESPAPPRSSLDLDRRGILDANDSAFKRKRFRLFRKRDHLVPSKVRLADML